MLMKVIIMKSMKMNMEVLLLLDHDDTLRRKEKKNESSSMNFTLRKGYTGSILFSHIDDDV